MELGAITLDMQQSHAQSNLKTAILWRDSNASQQPSKRFLDQSSKQPLEGPLNGLVNTLLEQQYRTLSFTDRTQAAEAVATYEADLLLIDLPTVGLQGYDLCRVLRKQLTTKYLPIVFIGVSANRQERLEALRCGSSEYLSLPISAEECWLSLRPHLESYQRVRQLQTERLNLSAKVGHYSHLLAQHAKIKASLAEENQALQALAFIDGLTQVGNRRQFDHSIAQLWEAAGHQGSPLSLIMCDIDYFKQYNDTYGHLAGDDCLRSVATALTAGTQRCVQPGDVQVARYGGEEFAILLPYISHKKAQQVARSVQFAVASQRIPHSTSLVKSHVSISVGVHTLVPGGRARTCERLVHGADRALYAAKLRGRDRIVATTPLETTADRSLGPVLKPLASGHSSRRDTKPARFSTRLSGHVA